MSQPSFHLANDLELPRATVTQRLAFMGRSGSGKTYAAGKLAEEMLDAGAQVVILDPVGNWYGLRLAAGGKGRGFEIPVLGGDQGDIPLEPAGGALVADTIVDRGISAVVDVSRFRKGQRAQFVTDFAEQLFHRKKGARTPMHLIVEEAHVFIPQRTMHGQERLLGAMEDLVRLGRNYGIGVSLLSQRPQSVNKDALNQTEILVALQLTGPQERAAIEAWIEGHGLELPDGQDFVRELPGLPVGEAWVWSPQFLRVLKRVRIAKKRTLDASATPEAGAVGAAAPVKPLGKEEIEALRGAMAEVVKRAEQDDPKALRKRIAELEKAIGAAKAAPAKVERVEVPAWPVEDMRRFENELMDLGHRVDEVRSAIGEMVRRLGLLQAQTTPLSAHSRAPGHADPPHSFTTPPRARSGEAQASGIVGGARRMLDVLAAFSEGRTRRQVATLSGLSVRSGTFANYLSNLRTAGLIEYRGQSVVATPAGMEAAGGVRPAPEPAAVRGTWMGRMPGGARKMLEVLIERYPRGFSRADLADAAGLSAASGTYANYLSVLRGNSLVEERDGQILASADLF